MSDERVVRLIGEEPYKIGRAVGFDKLGELHNEWLKDMIFGVQDETLLAHRLSYKTTCLSLAIPLLMILHPERSIIFMRKTGADVAEIVKQCERILSHPVIKGIAFGLYGEELVITSASMNKIETNFKRSARGTPQLLGMGVEGSLTGKHAYYIFTDDIVNLKDRVSRAEREHTKAIYQELQNVVEREGRIFNTGTPWHKDDCISTLMPNVKRYTYEDTHLIDDEKIDALKNSMTSSLFAANYELKHIADDDVIFTHPQKHGDPQLVEQARFCHLDAAYGGEDYTAFTICNKRDGKYYVFGKIWRKHVDDVTDEILKYYQRFMGGKILLETNGDKGYLARELKKKGARTGPYHENMNKDLKITTYLKGAWADVVFVDGTDESYIDQICDYNDHAEHDDAPDSLSSVIRHLWNNRGN